MAENNDKPKKFRRTRKLETVRERSTKSIDNPKKISRISKTRAKVKHVAGKVVETGKKEVYIPMPDNRAGRFLNKRRSFMPTYFVNSWRELKQVSWPGRKETWQLTFAVFVFAFVFGLLITVTDYGLDKLFKKLILK